MLRIVEAAQANGFTYIAIGQHFLYGELRWLQPVPLLARLAAEVDPHVRLVTQIMIAPLYHPVMLAEEIATLDVVTEGRLVFGAGLGYRPEEFDYLDVPYKQRAGRFDESLELMKRLWTEETVTLHGKYWQLDDVHPHLFPVQQPHPPIWIGAHAIPGVRRAAKYGDAYACPPETPKHEVARRYAIVHGRLRRAGQGVRAAAAAPQLPGRRHPRGGDRGVRAGRPGPLPHLCQQGPRRHEGQATSRTSSPRPSSGHAVIGTPDEVVAKLTDYVTTLPVDPLLLRPQWPTMDGDETIAAIDRLGSDVVPAMHALDATHDDRRGRLRRARRGAERRDGGPAYYTDLVPAFPDPETWTSTTCCATTRPSGPTRSASTSPRRA